MSRSPISVGETLTGELSNRGKPVNRKTILTLSDSNQATVVICPKGRQFELSQLAASIVSIEGEYQTIKNAKEPCFFSTSFEIKEIVKGRPAIIGRLTQVEKGKYAVVSDSGKSWRLANLTSGTKELVGKIVVMDLVANDASGEGQTWLIARAFQMPTP